MKQGLFLYFSAMVFFLFFSCSQKQPPAKTTPPKVQRFGMVTGIKPEKIPYYKQLHAAVWPAVRNKIKECHIQHYSIYLKEVDGKPYLFSYFEYTGDDFDADMQKMAADSATRRWWRETDPAQRPLPDAAAKKQIWSPMEEVFHLQ
ncbi:L-rhamnose mutarotase [Niabella aurantiaca]|uniref:L-rhamnose mutarotase n=1 Tax=Niabella aurantiaca TaxID=379900 RepID=UPI000364FCB9|nr:L-rhamnose mutarotase [Niabella aurantiaca]